MYSNKINNTGNSGKAIVDIIICVHNALEYVKECFDSIFKKKTIDFNLIIVDDGSDENVNEYLNEFAKENDCVLIRHDIAKGYTVSANEGLRVSKSKFVILLNSDTIVTKGWIEKLIECAKYDSKTGVIGPLSNAASWQSTPRLKGEIGYDLNLLPKGINLEIMSLLVEFSTLKKFPRVPLVNGFCYMIKRKVINKVGYFDEETFPKGYGEEDDYSIRVKKAGFNLRIADHCYVYHNKTKSFTPEKRLALCKSARKLLREKQGEKIIKEYVNEVMNNKVLKMNRENVKITLDKLWEFKKVVSKSVLFLFNEKDVDMELIIEEMNILTQCGLNIKIAVKENLKNMILENNTNESCCHIFYNSKENLVNIMEKFDLVLAVACEYGNEFIDIQNLTKKVIYAYNIQKSNTCLLKQYNSKVIGDETRKEAWDKLLFLNEIINKNKFKERY